MINIILSFWWYFYPILDQKCRNNTSEECLKPLYCVCNKPAGGIDCGIDLTNTPQIQLDHKCCDLRTKNCDVIEGFGYPLSVTDTIYVKVEFIEVNEFKSFLMTIQFKFF